MKIELEDNSIKFNNFKAIYFPHNCIVCGNTAQKQILKKIYGIYTSKYDYKKDYSFSIPVCKQCKTNLEMKTGLKSMSGKLLLISILLGGILSFIAYSFTFSIFLSIGIVVISFVIPFINHKQKTKSKIEFDDFLKIKMNKDDLESVELKFKNEEYAKNLRELNFAKLKKEAIEQKEATERKEAIERKEALEQKEATEQKEALEQEEATEQKEEPNTTNNF